MNINSISTLTDETEMQKVDETECIGVNIRHLLIHKHKRVCTF